MYNNNDITDRPGSALSNKSNASQGLKMPSRPPPMPPVIAQIDSDDVNDSQHSSSPAAEENGDVTFKVIPPTPDVDANTADCHTKFGTMTSLKSHEPDAAASNIQGPPRRPAPLPPPLDDDQSQNKNYRPDTERYFSDSLGRETPNEVHVNARVNVINGSPCDLENSFNMEPPSPKISSPLPPPPDDTVEPMAFSQEGFARGVNTVPRARMSSSSSTQDRHHGIFSGSGQDTTRRTMSPSHGPGNFGGNQTNIDGFRPTNRLPEFATLTSQSRLQSQEMLCERSGFLTMQRPGPIGTMGTVRAATLSRHGTDLVGTLGRPSGFGSSFNPSGLMSPMNEKDEIPDNDKALLQRYGSTKYLSIGYCVLMSLMSGNLYMCQFYRPLTVKASTVHIFSVLLYIIGIILAIMLIFVCQLSKHDPKGIARDHRHCSVYLRGALVVLCLLTSVLMVSNIASALSFILDYCMEEYIAKLFHYGFLLIFCYLQVYIIIVHSKLYITLQKCMVSIALAHLTFLNIYLIFTVVINQINSELAVQQLTSASPTEDASRADSFDSASSAGSAVAATKTETTDLQSFITKSEAERRALHCDENGSNFNKTLVSFSRSVSRYFYPFAVNFGILSLAFIGNLWCNVKKGARRFNNRLTYNLGQRSKYFNCHHTSIGLLLGLAVFLVSTIYVLLFAVFRNEHNQKVINNLTMAYHLFLICLMILMIATIFKCIISFQLFTAKKTYHNILDKPLLLISLIAIFLYYLFCIVACFGNFLMLGNDLVHTILPMLSYTLCLLEALLQVIFLLDALKRQATRKNDPSSRKFIVLILTCNLSLWLLMISRLGNDQLHSVEQSFYKEKWLYVRGFCGPFVIYFYLHSVACFFDIWQFSYN